MATAELIRAYLDWQSEMGTDEVILPHPLVKKNAGPSPSVAPLQSASSAHSVSALGNRSQGRHRSHGTVHCRAERRSVTVCASLRRTSTRIHRSRRTCSNPWCSPWKARAMRGANPCSFRALPKAHRSVPRKPSIFPPSRTWMPFGPTWKKIPDSCAAKSPARRGGPSSTPSTPPAPPTVRPRPGA